MATTVQRYEDPLINLIKDPELNKSKAKSNELLKIINTFQSKELNKIKKKCILGFQILRDLERLELRSKNWEFLSLDFSIESILNNEGNAVSETKLKFNRDIAKKVLKNCVEMHSLINELSGEIDEINSFIRSLNTWEYISDPGTILTQLMLRTIDLKQKMADQLTILYAKAKLINIGTDLELLLEQGDRFSQLTESTVESYRDFINQLLRQLNDAIELNDSIEIMECVEIVNDVESMFESISMSDDAKLIKEEGDDRASISSSEDERRLFDQHDSQKRPRRLSLSSVTTQNSMLHKTTLQDELPYLMTAFDNAKVVEEEIREFRPQNTASSPSTSTSNLKKSVYFGPALPHHPQETEQASSPPLQENFIPQLSSSYIFDNNSSFFNRMGIRPQVIQVPQRQQHSESPNSSHSGYSRFGKKMNTLTESNLNVLNDNNNNDDDNFNDNDDLHKAKYNLIQADKSEID